MCKELQKTSSLTIFEERLNTAKLACGFWTVLWMVTLGMFLMYKNALDIPLQSFSDANSAGGLLLSISSFFLCMSILSYRDWFKVYKCKKEYEDVNKKD